jgi:hypothetical protein
VKYPIWRKFSQEARRAAATAEYVIDQFPRTPNGFCPLGIALNRDGLPAPRCPEAYDVQKALTLSDYGYREAARFISAWDRGDVDLDDLPALFGVGL